MFHHNNFNPIFIEYYSHTNCDCYKILNPFTRYKEDKIVLCSVDDGYERACNLAIGVINQNLMNAIREPIK